MLKKNRISRQRGIPGPLWHGAEAIAALPAFLNDLSSILILCGVTPSEFATIAKKSFVVAAQRHSKLRNGRVNASRVAALTGLTRAEVRALLLPGEPQSDFVKHNRAIRVVEGWLSDADFQSRSGDPRPLSLTGKGNNFHELVRRYSGDIPTKSLLLELQRMELGIVKNSKVILSGLTRCQSSRAFEALFKWSHSVSPSIVAARDMAEGKGRFQTQTIKLLARDKIDAALIHARAQEIVTAATAALRALSTLRSPPKNPGAPRSDPPSILISTLISKTIPPKTVRAFSNYREKPSAST